LGQLTTHVLDTASGRPASGLQLSFYDLDDARRLLGRFVTNADGRLDAPLLAGDSMRSGRFELAFHAGDYFAAQGIDLPEPRFLDVIVLQFGIADAGAHYHVPLLCSPWSYSTYRGS
jgi:5-hydroxyisourate hydrolase